MHSKAYKQDAGLSYLHEAIEYLQGGSGYPFFQQVV